MFDGSFQALKREFDAGAQTVIARAQESGVCGMLVISNDFGKTKEALTLCEQYAGILYCAVGLHPDKYDTTLFSHRLDTALHYIIFFSMRSVSNGCTT
jgi:Tat protein secretion system quality control protein TatD with DNase activity